MPPAPALLLALVLALSLPMTAVATTGVSTEHPQPQTADVVQPLTVPVENTTNRLTLPAPVESGYVSQGPDLATALAGGDQTLRVDAAQYGLVDSAFAGASDDERADRLEAAYADLQNQIRTLEDREQTAVTEHAAGDRSEREVVDALLQNYHQATALQATLEELDELADRTPGYSLPSDDRREDTRLIEAHESPVRTAIATASEEPSVDPVTVAVQTSDDGVHLGLLEDSTYLFETIRFDNLDREAPAQFQGSEPLEYAQEQYPWAEREGSNNWVEAGTIHDIRFTADEFDVRIFLDSGSGEVFREFQELSMDALPVAETWSESDEGLTLSGSATPANGPVSLSVTEDDGEAVDATVAVDGYELGETDDGEFWLLPPRSSYQLTVETADATLETTIEPTAS